MAGFNSDAFKSDDFVRRQEIVKVPEIPAKYFPNGKSEFLVQSLDGVQAAIMLEQGNVAKKAFATLDEFLGGDDELLSALSPNKQIGLKDVPDECYKNVYAFVNGVVEPQVTIKDAWRILRKFRGPFLRVVTEVLYLSNHFDLKKPVPSGETITSEAA